MKRVLILQLDGKIPNIALMRISAHHKERGDSVRFERTAYPDEMYSGQPDMVYASTIFEKTRPLVREVLRQYPNAIIGGTGWSLDVTTEQYGITAKKQDYGIYPNFKQSIGFTQRGCRLKCPFCVVPKKEGTVREEQTITEIWRGDPWPRELLLLDNDFFGQPHWETRIDEIKGGKFKVSFNQGINARFLTDESAAAIASVDYRDDSMKRKCIYTAWDNRKDEHRLFHGLELLCKYGVRPQHITVYILVGYWPGETLQDAEYRRKALREFGAVPYPMPYTRTKETIAFQRWVVGAYDKAITWDQWRIAGYYPTGIVHNQPDLQ